MAKNGKTQRTEAVDIAFSVWYNHLYNNNEEKSSIWSEIGLFTAFVEVSDSLTVAMRFCELEGNNLEG